MTWKTKVKNLSGTDITVNGTKVVQGRETLLQGIHDVVVAVPEVGTVRFTDPGANDNYHQYVPTTWAVKVIAGDYVRYWGYEGEPTLDVTINDDRTFSLPAACNIDFSRVPISDHAITQYSGVYSTNTEWWGDYFSPLMINDDGTIAFGMSTTSITPTFNSTTATISFDWTQYKNTTFKASFQLVGVGGNIALSGSLNPRPQDGGVQFTGSLQTLYFKPSLSNIRSFDTFLKEGDSIELRSQPMHLAIGVDSNLRLIELQSTSAAPKRLTVKFPEDADGFILEDVSTGNSVVADDSGQLFLNASESSASLFHLYICMDGDVMIGTGSSDSPATNLFMKRDPSTGLISLARTLFLNADQEFLLSLPVAMAQQPAKRAAQYEALLTGPQTVTDLPCEIVNLQLIAHCTVGFLPLLGLGEFTMTSQILTQMKIAFDQYLPRFSAALTSLKVALAAVTTDASGKLAAAGLVVTFVGEIYTSAPDLINKWLRIAWETFGWWNFAKAAANLGLFFLPANPAGVAKVMQISGNLALWFLTLFGMKADINRCIFS